MKDFTVQLLHMQGHFIRQLMRRLDHTEISIGQPKVLAYLSSKEGNCQKEIAKACMLEPGSVTVLLNRMERQGLVERRFEGGNRKTRRVYLTDRGHELAATVIDRFYEVESTAFDGVSEEDRKVFTRVCDQIIENLSKTPE